MEESVRRVWAALGRESARLSGITISDLFGESDRTERLTFGAGELRVDFSRQRIDDEALRVLLELVRASDQALIALMHAQPGGAVVVGAEQLRAVIGTMAQARTGRAIYVAAGRFDEGALEFAKAHPIQLLSGDMLLAKILQIPEDRRNALLALATEGEWTTPTCPACAAKMVRRAGGGHDFWVCSNMPQCTATMPVAQS